MHSAMRRENMLYKNILGAVVVAGVMSSCVSKGNNTGIEYAPNMYVSEAYEAYTQEDEMKYNPYGMTMREPVKGTVARGQLDYIGYKEGYEASSDWNNPYPAYQSDIEGRIKSNYTTYCSHCHGNNGKNDGGVIKSGQYPPPPWDGYGADYVKELPDGKIWHTITYGKGNMGSHASVLTPKERWELVHYVRYLGDGDNFQFDPEPSKDAPIPGEQMGENSMNGGTNTLGLNPRLLGALDGYKLIDINAEDWNMLLSNMRSIKFEFARKKIKEESFGALDKVATFLQAHPDFKAVLGGHTAGDADNALKGELGLKRSQEVKEYLVSKGIAADRLKVKSMGSSDPIASNDSKEGRDTNRRVEIYIVE
jgi:outer membrane protein OmpA-like peptidoglycan-associated protein